MGQPVCRDALFDLGLHLSGTGRRPAQRRPRPRPARPLSGAGCVVRITAPPRPRCQMPYSGGHRADSSGGNTVMASAASTAVRRPQSTVRRPPSTVHCPPSTVCRLLAVHGPPSVVHCPLSICCLPSIVHRSSSTVHRLTRSIPSPCMSSPSIYAWNMSYNSGAAQDKL